MKELLMSMGSVMNKLSKTFVVSFKKHLDVTFERPSIQMFDCFIARLYIFPYLVSLKSKCKYTSFMAMSYGLESCVKSCLTNNDFPDDFLLNMTMLN